MSDQILARGKYLNFLLREGYEMVERINCTGVVVIVPLTANREIVLIDQYRRALGARVVELPAGLVNDVPGQPAESLESAGLRELIEETGYQASALEFLARWPTSSGMTSEMVDVYVARGVVKIGAGGGDETEDINVHLVPLAGVKDWLAGMVGKNFLVDPKVYAVLHLVDSTSR